jgi:hypothetical protein
MAGGDCQQLALTPDFTPHDPLYGSSLAYELCTIVRNSKSHDSRSGRSSKTEGKGADNSRGSAGADPRRALSLELGDRVQSGMYGFDVSMSLMRLVTFLFGIASHGTAHTYSCALPI